MDKCAKHGRNICWWCITQSMAFPIEHFVWERLPVLSNISRLLGV